MRFRYCPIYAAAAHADTYDWDRTDLNWVIGIALTSIAVSLTLALMLIRSIMASLSTAVSVSSNIAQGRLGNRIAIRSKDELGKLLSSLQQMDAKLHEIVSSVSVAADSVGVATKQLSQGNDDLSNRTQEQAAAIEETAASKSIEAQAGMLVSQISCFGDGGQRQARASTPTAAASQGGMNSKVVRMAAPASPPRAAAKPSPKPFVPPALLAKASGDDSMWQEF